MQNRHPHHDLSPVDRLLRDLRALGRLDADHVSATERLHAELGDDLFAVLRLELADFDAASLPLSGRTRHVA
jgi:hypothetical protein